MLPASMLPVEPGNMVLDLCAAPGGKTTELSLRLQGRGLLVANDASPSRAKALLKNLAVWGAGNCCITGETPQRLLESFGCFFDRILVDAPCSGEGMFRKDAGLVDAWLRRGPREYAKIQREILTCAVRMLKPGGFLVYSTCTFSEEEDEEVVRAVMEDFPELELAQPELSEGFAQGRPPCERCVRIWPHRVKGEGHFAALLHRRESADGESESENDRISGAEDKKVPKAGSRAAGPFSAGERRPGKLMPAAVREFLEQLPRSLWEDCTYEQIGEQCLLLPPYPLPGKLRYLRTGILAGTLKRGRFEPSQALAMLPGAAAFPNVVDLPSDDARILRYLRGETVELSSGERADDGWTLVCTDGFALGWGKCSDGRIKNKYYPGWRLQG